MYNYPVRCVILDIAGESIGLDDFGVVAATPEVSKKHIGKHGIAEIEDEWTVKITLDDGSILYGYECWWTSEEDWETSEKLKGN